MRAMAREMSRRELRRALFDAKRPIERGLQDAVRSAFRVRGSKFAQAFKGWVSYKDDRKMPVAVFKFVVPWSGIFVTGGTVNPVSKRWLIIPINARGDRRIKPSAFYDLLHREYTNISWHPAPGGRYLLTYERHRDESHLIHRFRLTAGGKRQVDVPIAVAVPRVTLGRRLELEQLTRSVVLPEILSRIGR